MKLYQLLFLLCFQLIAGCSEKDPESVLKGCCGNQPIDEDVGNGHVYVANIFTPNGDGVNDIFQLRGQNIESVDFWITDRWGRMMFVGNSLTATWDGKLNGNDVPDGVYFIGLHYKYVDEIEFHDDGMSLTLMR